MAKKAKKEPTGRFKVIVTPKAFKELMTPLKIENYYDPALVNFGEKDSIYINAHDAGKQTMLFVTGKYDGLRVMEPGKMVVNPTEMLKRVLPKFGNHNQFNIEQMEDGSYKFSDEWGAYLDWTPDAESECKTVKENLAPKLNEDGFMSLFDGQIVTDSKTTGKASQFQLAGNDASATGADYIELNFNASKPHSASGHLIAGKLRSGTPLDVEVEGAEVVAVVPASFSKFAALLTGEVSIYASADSPAIVIEANEPDRSYTILVGTTEPTEASSEEPEEAEEPEEEA